MLVLVVPVEVLVGADLLVGHPAGEEEKMQAGTQAQGAHVRSWPAQLTQMNS